MVTGKLSREDARKYLEDTLDAGGYTGELREGVKNLIQHGECQEFYQGVATGINILGQAFQRVDGNPEAFLYILAALLRRTCELWLDNSK
ncbi:MAG: hypothetical protein HY617_01950 [Candidatus Sungbacteria bacterium]|nr:hypothetical protein [Candidatus Sungbacteria bacterium]